MGNLNLKDIEKDERMRQRTQEKHFKKINYNKWRKK